MRVLALVWDNASWHISQEVRAWSGTTTVGLRPPAPAAASWSPPTQQEPWLNAIEPKWVHGKRAVVEPERKLGAAELKQRLCEHYRSPLLQPLAQQVA